MTDLTVSNLNKIVQSGNVEQLLSGSMEAVPAENRVMSEMQNQGMSSAGAAEAGKNFSDILRDSVDKANLYQKQADTAVSELVAGRNKNIHETMLTIERADTSLKLMMQVRNKILDAYKEIMRMQI